MKNTPANGHRDFVGHQNYEGAIYRKELNKGQGWK